jgi:hypothetical protein
MSDDIGFNEGIARWLQNRFELSHTPVVKGTEWVEERHWSCGEGTCDNYEAGGLSIDFDNNGTPSHFTIEIEDYGFGRLVKEIAGLMP